MIKFLTSSINFHSFLQGYSVLKSSDELDKVFCLISRLWIPREELISAKHLKKMHYEK